MESLQHTSQRTSPEAHRRVLGIELADGATRITALLDTKPSARRWHTRLSAPPSPDVTISHLTDLIGRALRETRDETDADADHNLTPLAAVGIALWGRVDPSRGMVREFRPLEGWAGFPLADTLRQHLHCPIILATATSAAAVAEAHSGAAAGVSSPLYVHLGRSISAALVREGALVLGDRDGEGMLAHMAVVADGPRCSCGLAGHLEPIASAQAIVRRMIGLASDSEESTAAMLRVSQGRAEAMSAMQVVRLAAEGEPVAAHILRQAIDALATALANATALLAPDAIVVGGPLAEAGEAFLAPLRSRLDEVIRPFAPPPLLHLGVLEPFAALIGAHILAESWHNT